MLCLIQVLFQIIIVVTIVGVRGLRIVGDFIRQSVLFSLLSSTFVTLVVSRGCVAQRRWTFLVVVVISLLVDVLLRHSDMHGVAFEC